MFTTVSARDIQRNYRGVIDLVHKSQKPVIVIARNKPEVALVSLETLKRLEVIQSIEAKHGSAKALLRLAGIIKEGLPVDLAQNHDIYTWE